MKTRLLFFTVLILSGLLFSSTAFAQHDCKGQNQDKAHKGCIMEELTPDQQKKVETIKMESEKKVTLYKADLKIKKAELEKLMIAENPVQKDINTKIDEISVLKASVQKENVNRRLLIRNELTPEQRAKFDAMHAGKGMDKKCKSEGEHGDMHKGCDKEGMNQNGGEGQMHKGCDKAPANN
jgi:Spy/CpxP family protein refolding chaperone